MSLEKLVEKVSKPIKIQKLIEEAQKDLTPKGSGITCMIQGKYSREYTDYYLNQLADFFNFDFFQNRKEEIISNLKENQRFKPYREYLEEHEYKNINFIVESAGIRSKHCLDGEISQHKFEDMMFFDSLIMNNKRNIDDFGFIVDKDNENKKYEFICFYDEYNSMFDHLNGIDEENYYNVIRSLSSWIDNDNIVRRQLILSVMSMYVQQRHIDKIQQFAKSNKIWQFKDNEHFQIDELKTIQREDTKLSIYDFHIQRALSILPGILQRNLKLNELFQNSDKFKFFLMQLNEQDSKQLKTYSNKNLMKTQIQQYKDFIQQSVERFRQNFQISIRKN